MITSVQNPKIKWVRLLQSDPGARREAEAFVVEGVRLAEEAATAGYPAQLVLYSQGLGERGRQVVDRFAANGAAVEMVADHVLRAASDTQTPQGVLAVVAMRSQQLPAKPEFIFIPDSVRDPGNLGSMLRTAAAAGVQAVLVPKGSVDAYAPKVVRAAMGAHFHLPIVSLAWEEIADLLLDLKVDLRVDLQIYLADAAAGEPYFHCDLRRPLVLIVGGEADGAGEAARRLANATLHIPMASGVESLNAAAAAAVLLFEIARQRTDINK
jgi:TrmH family RNA methyltransferase